jgi:hypothetical protein
MKEEEKKRDDEPFRIGLYIYMCVCVWKKQEFDPHILFLFFLFFCVFSFHSIEEEHDQ